MAVYYLDKINGLDSNSGTSIANAFKTWSKVLAVNVSGDTVYVLPATYNEVISTTQNGVKYIAVNDGVCSLTQNVITTSITYSGDCIISAFDINDNLINTNVRISNTKNNVSFVGFIVITNNNDCYTGLATASNNLVYKCYLESRGLSQAVTATGTWTTSATTLRKCILNSSYRCIENGGIFEYCRIYSTVYAALSTYMLAFCEILGGAVSSQYIINCDTIYGGQASIIRNTIPVGNPIISYNNFIKQAITSAIQNANTSSTVIPVKNWVYLCNTLNANTVGNTTNTTKIPLNDLYYTNYVAVNTGTLYEGSPKLLTKYQKRCNDIQVLRHDLGFSVDDSKYSVSGSSLNYYMNYNFDLTSTTYNSNSVYYNPNNYTLFYSTSNVWKIVNSAITNDSVSNYYSGSTITGLFYGVGTYSGDTCYVYDYINLVDSNGYTTDFEDMPIRNFDNIMQIGANQTSDIDYLDVNSIKINRRGFNIIKLKVLKNQTYKIDVNLTFSGSTNPEIRIYDYENNDIIKNIEYEISGLSNGVETNYNNITFTPNKTGIIRIIFYNTDYNVNSYLIVKDVKILKV